MGRNSGNRHVQAGAIAPSSLRHILTRGPDSTNTTFGFVNQITNKREMPDELPSIQRPGDGSTTGERVFTTRNKYE